MQVSFEQEMSEKPLAGMKILVTRPRDQAVLLAHRIEHEGGIPMMFPLLEITPVQDTQALFDQVSRLAQFDLAVFISPNAVQYGMTAIRSVGELPPSLRIAAIGQSTARALHILGVATVIVPEERFDSEGLLAHPDLQNITGWHVIIFRGDEGRELLGDTLKSRGAAVEYAACYHRSKPQSDSTSLLTELPDVITVTSSEALRYLFQMLDAAQRERLCSIPLFVPHKRIAEQASAQGWRHVQLTGPGEDGLLSALIAWKSEGKRQGVDSCSD